MSSSLSYTASTCQPIPSKPCLQNHTSPHLLPQHCTRHLPSTTSWHSYNMALLNRLQLLPQDSTPAMLTAKPSATAAAAVTQHHHLQQLPLLCLDLPSRMLSEGQPPAASKGSCPHKEAFLHLRHRTSSQLIAPVRQNTGIQCLDR